jgi:hypothetical protein
MEEAHRERALQEALVRQHGETYRALCAAQAELESANRELARLRAEQLELERTMTMRAEIHRVELEQLDSDLKSANQRVGELEQLQLATCGMLCA